jgi:probable addiction module antidote protein
VWAGWNKVCWAIAGLSGKVFQSFGYFLDRAIGSILAKRLIASSFCCAAATNPVKTGIYSQRRHIGRSTKIMAKRIFRQFRDVEEEYFRNHPEEIDPYLDEIFDAYAEDHDSASLLASLRVIAKVKGISNIAEETGLTRQGIQHALSSKGNPRFDNVNSIMNALGYRLVPEKLDNGQRI